MLATFPSNRIYKKLVVQIDEILLFCNFQQAVLRYQGNKYPNKTNARAQYENKHVFDQFSKVKNSFKNIFLNLILGNIIKKSK
jgi:hypothetical protein